MPFVKLDTTILRSTIWFDREAREIFITALLLAEPRTVSESVAQLEADSLEETGWRVPPGSYGFVESSGPGLANLAGVEWARALAALKRLGSPEPESRSQEFEGRRLVRVNGGYIALNFTKYREKDHTATERSKRYRDNKKKARHAVASQGNAVASRDVYVASHTRDLPLSGSPQGSSDLDPDLSDPLLAKDLTGSARVSEPSGTIPAVWHDLKDWEPPSWFEAELFAAGVPVPFALEKLRELKARRIGGEAGVIDRDDYVRSQFPRWKRWYDRDMAQGRAQSGRSGAPRASAADERLQRQADRITQLRAKEALEDQ